MKDQQSDYISALIQENHAFQHMEVYALEHHVPIMDKVSMQFLCQLAKIHQPNNILEIGTAIGYSAIRLASQLPGAHITTLERDEVMIQQANENINKHQLNSQIEVMAGDATDCIKQLEEAEKTFDFIFIDAAKAQYQTFFLLAAPLLKDNGVIVCDNVLFRGFVADPESTDSPRLRKLADKIDGFNRWLMDQEVYETSILPIGDGMTISQKRA